MKEQSKTKVRSKGITLVALVVSVIILAILATITIGTIQGKKGIFKEARSAKTQAEIKSEIDVVATAVNASKTIDKYGDVKENNLKSALNTGAGIDKTTVEYDEKHSLYIVTFVESQREYLVTSKGYVKYMGSGDELKNTGVLLAEPASSINPNNKPNVNLIVKTLEPIENKDVELEYQWSTSENEIPTTFENQVPSQDLENSSDSKEKKKSVETPEDKGTYYLWAKVKIGDGEEIIEHFGPYIIGTDGLQLAVNPNGGQWRNSRDTQNIDGYYNKVEPIEVPSENATYRVTFNADGGTAEKAYIDVQSDFIKWTLDENSAGTLNNTGDKYIFDKANGSITARYKARKIGTLPGAVKNGYILEGWYDPDGEKVGEDFTPEGNVTLTAHWKIGTVIVAYDYSTNGGTSATEASKVVNMGENVDLTPTATKSGYTFVGWNTNKDATTKLNELNAGNADITLYAIYSKEITLTFIDFNGTEEKTSNIIETIYNNQKLTPTVPEINTYTGWKKEHWTTNDGSKAEIKDLTSNETYYAKYSKDITISFNLNGGTGNFENVTGTVYAIAGKENNDGITIPNNKPERAGATFKEWNTKQDGTGKKCDENTKFRDTTELFAIWEMNDATATLDSNGGTPVDPITKKVGEEIGELPTPTKDGYAFDGWFTEKTGGEKIEPTTKMPIGGATYYAHWTKNAFTVTYDYEANGGTGATKTTEERTVGTNIDLSNVATKAGYNHIGWSTNKDATAGETTIVMPSENITIYAIYKKDISLKFVDALGTRTKNLTIYNNAKGTTTTETIRDYEGWTARYWTTATTANGVKTLESNDTISDITANATYYARYKKDITITFDLNTDPATLTGEAPEAITGVVEVNSYNLINTQEPTITMPEVTATKTGYEFDHWRTENGEFTYTDKGTGTFGDSIKLYAEWKAKKYTATINPNGGLWDGKTTNSTITQDYGSTKDLGKATHTGKVTVTFDNNGGQNATSTLNSNKVFDKWELTGAGTISGANNTFTFGAGESTIKATYKQAEITLPNATKEGYGFSGWYNTEDTRVGGAGDKYTPSANETLTARWSADTHIVTYNYQENGGTSATKTTAEVNFDDNIDLTPTATKSGYTFVGWNTNKDATTKLDTLKMQGSDVTLYAIFSKKVTLTYKDAQGTRTQDVVMYNKNKGTATSLDIRNYEGWNITYWTKSTAADGAKAVDANTTINNIVTEATYYARYTKDIKISFNLNGGSGTKPLDIEGTVQVNSNNLTVTIEPEITMPNVTTTKEGYQFDGWATEDGTQTYEDKGTGHFGESVTLYAQWKENTYTISFNGNGGTGTMANITGVKYSESKKLPENTFTKPGYTFKGWATSENGEKKYNDKANVSKLTATNNGTAILYAVWKDETAPVVTITRTNYNTFNWTATDEVGIKGYKITTTDTKPLVTESGWTKDGTLTSGTKNITEAGTYYVWAKDEAGNVNNAVSISAYTITRNQGTGTTLLTKVDATNATTGTPKTDTTIVVLENTQIWASATVSTGYKAPVLKKNETTINAAGEAITITENITIKSSATANTYTVTLNPNGGSVNPTTKDVTYNETYGTLPTPIRENFGFDGWYTEINGGDKVESNTKVTKTENHTLYAHWTAGAYSITYNLNGGTVSSANPTTYTVESNEIILNNPTKNGYTFVGWTGTGLSTKTMLVRIPKGSSGNRAYTANYTANTYKVTFDAETNGGATDTPSKTVTYGGTYGSLPNAMKEGAEFKGWYTLAQGGDKVEATTPVTKSGNHTIYAQFEDITYTAAFNPVGGTFTNTSSVGGTINGTGYLEIKRKYGQEIGTLPIVTKDGFEFKGWYENYDGTKVAISSTDKMQAGDVTFEAEWEEIIPDGVTATFNGNGGTIVGSNTITKLPGEELGTLPIVEKDGYILDEWWTEQIYITEDNGMTTIHTGIANVTCRVQGDTGEWFNVTADINGDTQSFEEAYKEEFCTEYYIVKINGDTNEYKFVKDETEGRFVFEGTSINETTQMPENDVTYYAHWKKYIDNTEYAAVFDPNGGVITSGSNIIEKKTGEALGTLPTATRTGYKFDGWYEDVETGEAITPETTMPSMGITYYAKWIPNQYTLIFNGNGATSGSVNNVTAVYDANVTIPANRYVKTGHTFVTWNTKADGTGDSYAEGKIVKNLTSTHNGNVTLYAQWKEIGKSTATFDPNEGKISGANTISKTPGEALGTLPSATREGYELDGWYTAIDGGEKVTAETAMPAQDVIYYAHWNIGTYTATFDSQGGSTVSPITKQYNQELGTLPVTTRDGYDFNGWWETREVPAIASGSTFSILTGMPNKAYQINIEDAAQPVEGTTDQEGIITFDLSRAAGKTFTLTITGDSEIFTFVQENGQYVLKSKQITETSKMPGENVTYYAHWTARKATATFNPNGGAFAEDEEGTITKFVGEQLGPLPEATKEGYTLDGWYTEESAETKITSETPMPGTDTTYYAHWKVNEYTITLDTGIENNQSTVSGDNGSNEGNQGDGGELIIEEEEITEPPANVDNASSEETNNTESSTTITSKIYETYGVKYSLTSGGSEITSIEKPENVGYTFRGYYTEQDGNGTQIINENGQIIASNTTFTQDSTIYAKWTINSYTAIFNSNGGTTPTPSTITKEYGQELGELPTTERAGYTFNGWWTKVGTSVETPTVTWNDRDFDLNIGRNEVVTIWLGDTPGSKDFDFDTDTNGKVDLVPYFEDYYGDNAYILIDSDIYLLKFVHTETVEYELETVYIEPKEGTQITPATTVPAENVTYYAHWTLREYEITLNSGVKENIHVGDIVSYTPPTREAYSEYLTTAYTGYDSDQTIGQEYTKWKVLNINDDGTIDMIPAFDKTELPEGIENYTGIYFKDALGYNNGVYILNATSSYLYADEENGITARSINFEDITSKLVENEDGKGVKKIESYQNQVVEMIGNIMPGESRDYSYKEVDTTKNTVTYTSTHPTNLDQYKHYYPDIYAHQLGAGIDTQNVLQKGAAGVIGESDKYYDIPTTNTSAQVNNMLTTKITAYDGDLTSEDFKDINTYNVLMGTEKFYRIATRNVGSYSYFWAAYGMYGVSGDSLTNDELFRSNGSEHTAGLKKLCPVVTIKSKAKLTKEGDTWAISNESENNKFGNKGTEKIYENYGVKFSLTSAGEAITSIEKPTATGYTFDGYYTEPNGDGLQVIDENGQIVASNTTFTENNEVYANWIINSYTATFNSNGGSAPRTPTTTKEYGQELGTLPTTERIGYTFDGWWTEQNGGTKVEPTSKMPAANVTYYAHWIINKYKLTYDYNVNRTFQTKEYSDTGYKINWDKDFTIETTVNIPELGKDYILASGYSGSSTQELHITFNPLNQLVIMFGQGEHATRSDNNTVYANEDILIKFSWHANTNTYTCTAIGENTNITLNDSYVMSGNANYYLRIGCVDNRGADNIFNKISVTALQIKTSQNYGTTLEHYTEELTRTGYTFDGWYATKNPIYAEYNSNNLIFYTGISNANIDVAWADESRDNCDNSPNDFVTDENGEIDLSEAAEFYTGYDFDAWIGENTTRVRFKWNSSTGKYELQNNGKISSETTMQSEDATYYAHWNENTYNITFDNNFLNRDLYGSNTVNTANWSSWGTTIKAIAAPDFTNAKHGKALRIRLNAGTNGGAYYKYTALTPGKTYTWSVYLATSAGDSSGNVVGSGKSMTLNVGHEQGGMTNITTSGVWTKYTHTFVATDTTYQAFRFYPRDGSSWSDNDILFIHSLELAEESAAGDLTVNGANWSNDYLEFDGGDDWVSLGQQNFEKNVTLEADVVADTPSTTTTNEQIIIGNYDAGGYGLSIYNQKIRFQLYGDTHNAWTWIETPTNISANTRYHIIGTFDGETLKLYVNGSLVSSQAYIDTVRTPLNNSVLTLGTNPTGETTQGSFFDGKMYQARVYNKVLSAEEVAQNYAGNIVQDHLVKNITSNTKNVNKVTRTMKYGDSLGDIFSPERAGYAFLGWYTNPVGGTQITDLTSVPSSDTTYYAHWEKATIPAPTWKAHYEDEKEYQSGTWTNKVVYTLVSVNSPSTTIKEIQYSLDNGSTWQKLSFSHSNGLNNTGNIYSGDEIWLLRNGREETVYFRAVSTSGEVSPVSQPFIVRYDTEAPTVAITANTSNPTVANSITYTFQFNENVKGFEVGDISVTNGTKGTFTKITDSKYTLVVTGGNDGNQVISVAANACTDRAGNGNTANSYTMTIARSTPSIAVNPSSASVARTTNITITASSPAGSSLDPNNSYQYYLSTSATGLAGGGWKNYTNGTAFAAGSGLNGTYYLFVKRVKTTNGNISTSGGTSVTISGTTYQRFGPYEFDNTAPGVTITANTTSPTNASSITYTFTFTEDVIGLEKGDITVSGGTAGTLSGSGKTYTLVVTNAGSGTQTVTLAAGKCTDKVGNGNRASNTVSITIDRTAPGVTITANKSTYTNASSITYTFTFTENVTGFAKGDISITNGTAGAFSGSGKTYTLVVTNSGSCTQKVSVEKGKCTDSVGNSNTASNTLSIGIDRTAPTCSLATPTNGLATSLILTKADNKGGSGLASYAISTSSSAPAASAYVNDTAASKTITGLKPNTTYYVWVKDKAGNVSARASAKTLPGNWGIGSAKYDTLYNAMAASSKGNTIKLLTNNLTDGSAKDMQAKWNLTIDLDKKTVTFPKIIKIKEATTTMITGNGKAICGKYNNTFEVRGTLDIKNVTLESQKGGQQIANAKSGGRINVKTGATIHKETNAKQNGGQALHVNDGGELYIYDGAYVYTTGVGTEQVIDTEAGGKCIIRGGTVENKVPNALAIWNEGTVLIDDKDAKVLANASKNHVSVIAEQYDKNVKNSDKIRITVKKGQVINKGTGYAWIHYGGTMGKKYDYMVKSPLKK